MRNWKQLGLVSLVSTTLLLSVTASASPERPARAEVKRVPYGIAVGAAESAKAAVVAGLTQLAWADWFNRLGQLYEADQAVTATAVTRHSSNAGAGGGSCNEAGIIANESKGDPSVYNTAGSGASGLYQFMPTTWNGYGGYANAADAPPEVQKAKFDEVWAGGAGASNWRGGAC